MPGNRRMRNILDLIRLPEDEVGVALAADLGVEALDGVVVRDMRALWNVEANLRIILAARTARAWYRGAPGAEPGAVSLSEVTEPGRDEDGGGAHRLLSFARAAVNGAPLDTGLFVLFRRTSYLAVEAIASVREVAPLAEARRQLDAFFAYIERAARHHHEQARYTATLVEKAGAYAENCRAISRAFAREEDALLGRTGSTPFENAATARLESIERGVEGLRRKLKVPPVSSTAQRWALERWRYFCAHPEALGGDVTRRRVYVRDVWGTVGDEARERFGIADAKAFARVLEAARKGRCRV